MPLIRGAWAPTDMRDHRDHDAVPVQLADGWIGICATCGWLGESHDSVVEADDESRRHAELAAMVDSPSR